MSRFGLKTEPINPSQTYVKNGVRLSVITPRILRVERSADGVFEDRPTQMVFERNFANPQFSVTENGNKVTILTKQKEFDNIFPVAFERNANEMIFENFEIVNNLDRKFNAKNIVEKMILGE